MTINSLKENLIWTLRSAYKKNKASIWRVLEERLSASQSNKAEVNLDRLSLVTKEDEIVMIPGKVLGNGILSHKLTVCSFSISETAFKKISDIGGSIISVEELVTKYPKGTGVRIIG